MDILRNNLEDINKCVFENTTKFVKSCEKTYKDQVVKAALNSLEKHDLKFVLLAGPSSSGKTTTSKILKQVYKDNGYDAMTISLDDFFVERVETPFWEDGTYNYETFDAIDWKLFSICMDALLKGEPVHLPTYNFLTGSKEFGDTTTMSSKSIVIIEGLHALNPIIDKFIPTEKSFKIYISVRTDIFKDGAPYIDHETVRLFRRMIRDLHNRGNSIQETLGTWKKVGIGENLYINPYIENAEFKINSFHPYELCVMNKIFYDLFGDEIDNENVARLKQFEKLSVATVPEYSVLQEFMPTTKK